MAITSICYQIGMGLDQTACAIIGRLIGAGNHVEAKKFYNALIVTTSVIILSNALFLVIYQDQIIGIFSTDDEIINITKANIYLVAFCTVPDSIKGMMKGVIKALGA